MPTRSGNIVVRRTNRGGAFTLIELLTVVAVLGILVMIILPSFTLARKLAKYKMGEARMGLLSSACEMYKADFKDYPPSSDPDGVYFAAADNRGAYIFALLLTGYAPDIGTAGSPATPPDLFSTDDGKSDFGFRTSSRGQVWGPYGDASKIPGYRRTAASPMAFIDTFSGSEVNNPILYYRYRDSDNDGDFEYVAADNYTGSDVEMDGPAAANFDAYMQDGSGQPYRTDFMLISKGGELTWIAPSSGGYNLTNKDSK